MDRMKKRKQNMIKWGQEGIRKKRQGKEEEHKKKKKRRYGHGYYQSAGVVKAATGD